MVSGHCQTLTLNRLIVPLGRGYFLMIPGTSCLATIVLSLRDENHSPIEALAIILAALWVLPWVEEVCV
jgi:hypothetical protein